MSSATAASPASAARLKQLVQSHPLISFFVLAYLGTWLCLAPMVLGQDGLRLLPYTFPFPPYAALFLLSSFAGPTLAAFPPG